MVSSALPGGANVEFARSRGPRAFDLVVWERGVGRTLACGTGAAATVVAAALSERAPFSEPVEVRLPGGALEISVTRAPLAAAQRGPARLVFTGELR
jgi:diaminopimelate epimerase